FAFWQSRFSRSGGRRCRLLGGRGMGRRGSSGGRGSRGTRGSGRRGSSGGRVRGRRRHARGGRAGRCAGRRLGSWRARRAMGGGEGAVGCFGGAAAGALRAGVWARGGCGGVWPGAVGGEAGGAASVGEISGKALGSRLEEVTGTESSGAGAAETGEA